jgi:hypothetical protein
MQARSIVIPARISCRIRGWSRCCRCVKGCSRLARVDSTGWHSDDEPELGERPLIASLSLGAPRRFLLRRRDDHSCKREFLLGHGDLLVMAGDTQRFYQHALPKTRRPTGERINLTFRQILGRAAPRRPAGR